MNLLELTAQIVSAHITHNAVATADLPSLIQHVNQRLMNTEAATEPRKPATALVPAVPVKRSVFPDHIVCLEDGKKLKTLKRHLRSAYDMTPKDYRAKWGLPDTYPMVVPDYAERRSVLAKQIGLGRKAKTAPTVIDIPKGDEAKTPSEPRIQVLAERKRSRPRKVAWLGPATVELMILSVGEKNTVWRWATAISVRSTIA